MTSMHENTVENIRSSATVNRADLAAAVSAVVRAAEKKSPLPILSNVKILATDTRKNLEGIVLQFSYICVIV